MLRAQTRKQCKLQAIYTFACGCPVEQCYQGLPTIFSWLETCRRLEGAYGGHHRCEYTIAALPEPYREFFFGWHSAMLGRKQSGLLRKVLIRPLSLTLSFGRYTRCFKSSTPSQLTFKPSHYTRELLIIYRHCAPIAFYVNFLSFIKFGACSHQQEWTR